MEIKRVLRKYAHGNVLASEKFDVFEILQASAERDLEPRFLEHLKIGGQCPARDFLSRGDHTKEMAKICVELSEARKYAAVGEQRSGLS